MLQERVRNLEIHIGGLREMWSTRVERLELTSPNVEVITQTFASIEHKMGGMDREQKKLEHALLSFQLEMNLFKSSHLEMGRLIVNMQPIQISKTNNPLSPTPPVGPHEAHNSNLDQKIEG
jgi:hypothetical protein